MVDLSVTRCKIVCRLRPLPPNFLVRNMLDTPELDRWSQQLDYPRTDSLPILVGQVSSALAYIRQENTRLKQQNMQQNRKLRHAALRLSAAQAENAAMRENIRGLMLRNARLQKLCAARKKMSMAQET